MSATVELHPTPQLLQDTFFVRNIPRINGAKITSNPTVPLSLESQRVPCHLTTKDLPLKKALWTLLPSEVELDPLSFESAESLHSWDCGRSPNVRRAPSDYVFKTPTGRLEDWFELSGKRLGSGQYGTVWECKSRQTGETLACKSIRKSGGILQAEDIRGEVAIMLRLAGHENVMQLLGVFEDKAEVHLVMEFCEGGELFDEILRRQEGQATPFTEQEAALLFVELVRAVAFCHSLGVMHRDLKPENILLKRKLQPVASVAEELATGPLLKLADFGLSAPVAADQKIRGSAGSPFYVAPEVLTGEYNCKGDVWSLGVILYIILCGSPPFWGESDSEVFQAILTGTPDMISRPWNNISCEAKDLVNSLLTKDPTCRPSAEMILSHSWLAGKTSRRQKNSLQTAASCPPVVS